MNNEKEMLQKVGKNVAKLRIEAGLSQSELCAIANIEKATLGNIETGKTNPTIKTLFRIATALETSLSELVRYK